MPLRPFSPLRLALCLLLLLAAVAGAQEPQLSADQPISADLNSGELVALGNARFENEDLVVEAEEIRFNQDSRTITATGNVRVTQPGMRLVSERVTYNIDSGAFTSGPFRAGLPPIFARGQAFEGTLEDLSLQEVNLYYLEPDPASPALSFEEARLDPNDRLRGTGVGLQLPFVGRLPLPSFDRDLETPPLVVEGNLGYRGNLGAYARTEILAPRGEGWLLGGNLDLYAQRGVLLGPSLRYSEGDLLDGTRFRLSTGWIADQGDPGRDVQGEPIDRQRYFADLSLRHVQDDLEVVLRSSALSDSEIERDFRPDRYESRPQPASFLAVTQLLGDDVFLSVFLERNPHTFFRNIERVPEISLQAPLRPMGESSLLHSFEATYRRVRLWGDRPLVEATDPASVRAFREAIANTVWRAGERLNWDLGDDFGEGWLDLFEARYGLRAPLDLARGVTFVPVAEAKLTHWQGGDEGLRRIVGAGFDLQFAGHADFAVRNQAWRIDGLRHLVEPVLQYRRFFARNSDDLSPLFPLFDATRPDTSLLTRRDYFDVGERENFLRLGVRNTLLTGTGIDGEMRQLLNLNLFYDQSFADEDFTMEGRSYLEIVSHPARWLRLRFEQQVDHADNRLEELRLRATFRSADSWELTYGIDYFDDADFSALEADPDWDGEKANTAYFQHRLEGAYRLNPRATLIGAWRYDAERDRFTQQLYGMRYRVGRSWELEAGVIFRDGAQREDDFTVRFGVRLLEY
ncbi:MAG: hypothetical protein ACLFU2_01780 [Opitutales bacterium]